MIFPKFLLRMVEAAKQAEDTVEGANFYYEVTSVGLRISYVWFSNPQALRTVEKVLTWEELDGPTDPIPAVRAALTKEAGALG